MFSYYDYPRIQTLGQGPLVSVVSGVQQLSAEGAKLIQTLFTNQYPQLTGSWTAASGVTQPAFDQNADLWGYIAVPNPPDPNAPNNQTVYDQLQSLADKGLFLVDVNSAQGAIAGSPNPVVYAIAKNQQIVQMLAGQGGSLARVLGPSGAAGTTPAPKKASNTAPIVAGVSLLALLAIIAASA